MSPGTTPLSHDLFLLSLAFVAIGFAAGVLPFFVKWTHVTAHRWIAFGAGVILGAAFLHMIPEGLEVAGATSLSMTLLGFLTLYAFEQISLDHPHDEEKGEFYEIGLLTFLGLVVHSLIDGVALGSGLKVPELTPAIFTALVLHKIPTIFALSLLMVHAGTPKRRIMLYLTIVLLATPAGALVSNALLDVIGGDSRVAVGRLILYSAGTFLYIGAYELLPEMHRKSGPGSKIWLFFIVGLVVMAALKWIHPVF